MPFYHDFLYTRGRLRLLLSCALLAGSGSIGRAGVIINEVMHHPASGNLLESYVEVRNLDNFSTNISGWRFTKGVDFVFPTNTVIGPAGYLVVAANGSVFATKYPGVPNFVAGFSGSIGHHLELKNGAGQVIHELQFSDDGDWAVRQMKPASYGHQGWEWHAAQDGFGSSLELVNAGLATTLAQNWGPSTVSNGTPGVANSTASTNAAPFISEVSHSPVIPRSSDVVTISARITDERSNGIVVSLFYRDATSTNPPAFTSIPMVDDGSHGDGLAVDGIFGALLPAQPNGTVVEFYLQATDLDSNLRVYPKVIAPTNSLRTANLLYQVDDNEYTGAQPLYRIIMTEMERAELYAIGRKCPEEDSDAEMNATWITTDGVVSGGTTVQVRYNTGARNRGHGSRDSNPNNYHVNIPSDRLWKGQAGINLNSQFAHNQVLGSAIFRRAGLSMPNSAAVQVRVNSTNIPALPGLPNNNSYGSYAGNEQYNKDFIQRTFASDSQGNAYRGIRDQLLCDPALNSVADLAWHGPNINQAVYTNAYFKESKAFENDWSDLIDLFAVFNSTNGHAATSYAADVQQRINVEEWMQYMAVNTLLDNNETCLANGAGDDYGLYRGAIDTRFLALPYDLDDVLGQGSLVSSPRHSIFRMTAVAAMDRFMKTPQFAPIYHKWLKIYADSLFAPAELNPVIDRTLGDFVPQVNRDNMKAYNVSQVSNVLAQIPLTLTVSNSLTVQSGFPRTTIASVTLFGTANAIETRSVNVNGSPAAWTAWQGRWTNTISLSPGVNHVLIDALNETGVSVGSTNVDIWYDDATVVTTGGSVNANTTWTAAGGPYSVTSTLTVASNVTLTIQPGTIVYLGTGVNLSVANGGRLLAEGTIAAPIRFTSAPGSGTSWGSVVVNGGPGSPETRIANAFFDNNNSTCIDVNGGTVFLDHVSFGTTTHPYLALDNASFHLTGCVFPSATTTFELVHGTGGIKAGGRGIVRDCFFGAAIGNNDVMDYTGGNRDLGQPIIQFYNNVFSGATDDILDLDGTDAWIEGNIFLHAHLNAPGGNPLGTTSAISGGSNGSDTSQITAIGNIFYDCDQAAMVKQGNFLTFINNTVVHQSHQGGTDTNGAVVALADEGVTEAAGMYLEGNLIYDAENLVRNLTNALLTFSNNLMPYAWSGPGGGNSTNPPLLKYVPQLAETYFSSWQQAQVLRDWFSLLPGSPARAAGPNGRDIGGAIPLGVSISGEPPATNNQTTATLKVGVARTGSGIPTSSWPNGAGYTHYKWRLDAGAWSSETPIANPITLSGLANGIHHVEVSGKRDSGWYQDATELASDSLVSTSRFWRVDTSYVPSILPRIRLNEILASNATSLTNGGTTPDAIELLNFGTTSIDLSGMGLTDNASLPYKYTFPPATPVLGPGQYLIVYADAASAAPGIHLGFSLKASGDDVSLFDKPTAGGSLLDTVTFGIQITDFSIGRAADGTWVLAKPTFGSANIAVELADEHGLRINEWLADSQFLSDHDFVELYNPAPRPAPLGSCYLSDAAGAPGRNPLGPLGFIGAGGYASFIADGDPSQGADHLNFKLDANVGLILLSDAALQPIDVITYGPQRTDLAQGRSPSGSDNFADFPLPTPGGPNSAPNGGTSSVTNITTTAVNLITLTNGWKYDNSGGTNLGTGWSATAFNDASWTNGFPFFGTETAGVYPYNFQTIIPPASAANGHITTYYRTHFQWNGSLTNFSLLSTNYIDDGVVYYLNGVKVGSIRMPVTFTYSTVATQQLNEGSSDLLTLPTNNLVLGDNVFAAELHQNSPGSSDAVFGMFLSAVNFMTNVIVTTTVGVPVVLNEILANNHSLTNALGGTPDWVELYNTSSSNSVDLADLSLSNDPNAPRKFVFAPGTMIPPGGHLLINFDNNNPASTTNTGFALKTTGDSVFLFNSISNGAGLIDALNFGLQAEDFSVGRVPSGTGAWVLNVPTPGGANSPAAQGSVSALSFNEWMADPSSGSDWFELFNAGSQPVPLGGLFFTDDLTKKTQSPVPPLSFIGTGENAFIQFIADNPPNPAADHVRFKIAKSGGTLGLYSPAGLLITAVSYTNQQTGVSEGHFPDGTTNIAHFSTTVSPAESNFFPPTNVVINEILTHTDSPLEDAIELYNPSLSALDLSGWFLSNSKDDFKKYRIADGTSLPAHGFLVFYEYQFNPTNGSSIPFTLNSAHGDNVYLSDSDGLGNLSGYRAIAKLGAAANAVSFGRYTNSVGKVDYVASSARSFGFDNPTTLAEFRSGAGALNPLPSTGPVVINEIMFQPPSLDGTDDNTQDEYLELLNITPYSVPLFDPANPTNIWKIHGGIDFTFPGSTVLAAQGSLLLVNFNPATDPGALAGFRSRNNVSNSVPLFGPYSGKLGNSSDAIELYEPDAPQAAPHPDAGFVPYLLVDKVNYSSAAPWPAGAAGTGASLQRQNSSAYGDDPINWFVAAPTAGYGNVTNSFDADHDGLPDSWEIQYFGSTSDPRAVPGADPDGDGYTNLQEYFAGTVPTDANSALRITSIETAPGSSAIHFQAVAGRTYTIQYRSSLGSGIWLKLVDVPAQGTSGPITITDPNVGASSERYYRLVSPKL